MFIKHETTKIPSNVRKIAIKLIIMEIIFSIIFNALAFSIELGKSQIMAGHIIFGLIFIGLSFMEDSLRDFAAFLRRSLRTNLHEAEELSIGQIAINLLFKTRGKVWCKNEKNGSSEVMSASKSISICQNYLTELWGYKRDFFTNVAEILILLFTFVGFIKTTYSEIENSFVFISVIIFTLVISSFISLMETKVSKKFNKSNKKTNERKDELFNDILNNEPLNEEHAKYMFNKYHSSSKKSFENTRTKNFNISILDSIESSFRILTVIILIGINAYEVGLNNINLEVILTIISLLRIYSHIQSSISRFSREITRVIETNDKIKTYEQDFSKILEVYDRENQAEEDFFAYVSEIDVPKFEVQYPVLNSETPFLLKNPIDLTFKSGDIVLFVGPTGSGKSTLLKLVTSYMKFDSFKLNFKCTNGRIGTVMHQTDGRIGCNDILSEITLGKQVDTDKLFHILKGLHLYEEISAKDMDVTRYLRNSKINNYSTGQKQRLAIARLLYNLNDDIQIIAFDEATNALNDEITLQTLGFIKQFCKDKILFIATHQVDIGETVANKIIEFVPAGTHYEINQTL